MRHFVLVGDADEVLGVWEAQDEVSADRLRLRLSLTYPGCKTHVRQATDFESLKSMLKGVDLVGMEPEAA
jgi:hypothetical protein